MNSPRELRRAQAAWPGWAQGLGASGPEPGLCIHGGQETSWWIDAGPWDRGRLGLLRGGALQAWGCCCSLRGQSCSRALSPHPTLQHWLSYPLQLPSLSFSLGNSHKTLTAVSPKDVTLGEKRLLEESWKLKEYVSVLLHHPCDTPESMPVP